MKELKELHSHCAGFPEKRELFSVMSQVQDADATEALH